MLARGVIFGNDYVPEMPCMKPEMGIAEIVMPIGIIENSHTR